MQTALTITTIFIILAATGCAYFGIHLLAQACRERSSGRRRLRSGKGDRLAAAYKEKVARRGSPAYKAPAANHFNIARRSCGRSSKKGGRYLA
jgi:hypothetical protein